MTTKGTLDNNKGHSGLRRSDTPDGKAHCSFKYTLQREKPPKKLSMVSETGTGGEGAEHFPMLLRSDPPSAPVFRTGDGRRHLYDDRSICTRDNDIHQQSYDQKISAFFVCNPHSPRNCHKNRPYSWFGSKKTTDFLIVTKNCCTTRQSASTKTAPPDQSHLRKTFAHDNHWNNIGNREKHPVDSVQHLCHFLTGNCHRCG